MFICNLCFRLIKDSIFFEWRVFYLLFSKFYVLFNILSYAAEKVLLLIHCTNGKRVVRELIWKRKSYVRLQRTEPLKSWWQAFLKDKDHKKGLGWDLTLGCEGVKQKGNSYTWCLQRWCWAIWIEEWSWLFLNRGAIGVL